MLITGNNFLKENNDESIIDPNAFIIGEIVPKNIIYYDSVNNLEEMVNVFNTLDNKSELEILKIIMDSLVINKTHWISQIPNLYNPKFSYIQWPNSIIKDKEGICQDFALLVYLLCKKLTSRKMYCNLVFLSFIDSKTGMMQYGHTYPIIQTGHNVYWFWNFLKDAQTIHGEYPSFSSVFENSIEYFKAVFHTVIFDFDNIYNPLKLNLSNNYKYMLPLVLTPNDLNNIDEHVNKPITRTEFWYSIPIFKDYAKKIFQLSTQLLQQNGNPNWVPVGPVQNKLNLIKITKSLGHLKYLVS